jgi:cytoskeletal protein CcmA (bactofilin family)
MECYSEQTCAMFVDGELAANEAQRLRDHLVSCLRCRQLVNALRLENRVLSESLCELQDDVAIRESSSRLGWLWRWGALAVVAAMFALGSIVSVWLDELRVPEALEWLDPFSLSGRTNLGFHLSYYFAHGGMDMLVNYAAVVGSISLLLLLCGGALLLGRTRLRQPGGFLLLVMLIALSTPSFGLERRHGENVTVAPNETMDDTLLATGDSVRVDGIVNGDLVATGRLVEVRGTVKGDLLTWAQRTEVSGTVEGNIYTFSQSVDLRGQLGRNLYAWAQSMRVDSGAHVGDSIVVVAGHSNLEGEVARNVTIVAGRTYLSGNVGRDLTMVGGKGDLTLANTARVGGNLTGHVRQLKDVHIADGATIVGKRDVQVQVTKNRFTRPGFYFRQALWLAATMLVGWLTLILFPGFFQSSVQAVGSGWRSLVLGLAVLGGVPLAIVIIAITLVGIPVSLMLVAIYLAAIYMAKVWVGAFLGRTVLKTANSTKRDWLLGLLVGLLILTITGFIPYLGGLIRLAVICLGLGAFAWQLYLASRAATMA